MIPLNKEQKRFVHNKQCGRRLLKGETETGKRTAALYRTAFIIDNYCLYEEDNILILCRDKEKKHYMEEIYEAIDKDSFKDISLFSFMHKKPHMYSFDEFIYKYLEQYNKIKEKDYKIIEDVKEKENIMEEALLNIKEFYPKMKIFNKDNIEFFLEEIKWIKSYGYMSIELYNDAKRVGRKISKGEGPQKIPKNSTKREAIFRLMMLYNNLLRKKGYLDYEDMVLMALEIEDKKKERSFVHIVIDESENLTKSQYKFVKSLYREKTYSNLIFIFNNKCKNTSTYSYLSKGKGISIKALGKDFKSSIFHKLYDIKHNENENHNVGLETYSVSVEEVLNKENSKKGDSGMLHRDSLEHFTYCDLRHKRDFKFMRDNSNIQDILVGEKENLQEYEEEELKEVPVYSNIAAGMPILMNSEQEGNFYMPKYWLKGVKECFILKVKGDSMIGVNINDGDYVVIRKQFNADNRDIVAVNIDGNATLKRLCIGKNEVVLLPENKDYNPIKVDEEYGVSILGVALGIIKKEQMR